MGIKGNNGRTAPVKFYVGVKSCFERNKRSVFYCYLTPTFESHGDRFDYVIGPFKTREAADFMAGPGFNHPNCLTPNDAERFVETGSFAVVVEEECAA